jgi:glycosyltransferase involved in cell wall biosynthesis
VATLALEQARGLAELGHEVRVLAVSSPSAPVPGTNGAESFTICRRTTTRGAIARLPDLYRELRQQLLEFRPDIVWVPTYRGFGLPALLSSSRGGVPYGLYFHGTEIQTEVRGVFRRAVMNQVISRAALVCSNSDNTARLLHDAFRAANVLAVKPGVKPERFDGADVDERSAELRAQWRAQEPAAIVLLSMCRLDAGKGLLLVLQALAELLRTHPQLNWLHVIAGQGPQREDLLKYISQHGLSDRVRLLGPVEYDHVPAYYRAADVYVQPSQPHGPFLESFGISFLEAQAAGLACIGSDWGGVPEAVEKDESALLVPTGDVEALREAIRVVLVDPKRRQAMGERGKQIAQRHTWRLHAEQLSDALERAARRR